MTGGLRPPVIPDFWDQDHPRPEIYTDPGQAELVARYYADVAAFEANLGR